MTKTAESLQDGSRDGGDSYSQLQALKVGALITSKVGARPERLAPKIPRPIVPGTSARNLADKVIVWTTKARWQGAGHSVVELLDSANLWRRNIHPELPTTLRITRDLPDMDGPAQEVINFSMDLDSDEPILRDHRELTLAKGDLSAPFLRQWFYRRALSALDGTYYFLKEERAVFADENDLELIRAELANGAAGGFTDAPRLQTGLELAAGMMATNKTTGRI